MLITVQPDPNWQLSLAQLSPSLSLFRFNVKCKYCIEVKINNLQNKLKSKYPNVRVNIKNSYFTMGSLFFLTFEFLA